MNLFKKARKKSQKNPSAKPREAHSDIGRELLALMEKSSKDELLCGGSGAGKTLRRIKPDMNQINKE